MYSIVFSKQVKKFLNTHNEVALQLSKKLPLLQKDPFSKALDTKEIQWKEWKYRRLRVWKYRFIYLIKEKEVMIYFSWSMK